MDIVTGEIAYERVKEIGRGQGMNSVVFLAKDPQLNGMVAVKEIEKARLGNDVSRYFQEAQVMFATDHPNVVPISCAFQTTDKICLEMKYFRNGSLMDRTAAGPLGLEEVIRIGEEILRGVSHIHAKGFIHFDIKPSNVLFSDYGKAMVADFGQARQMGPNGFVLRPGMYPYGIPPECYSGFGVVQSDIYQVGLALYRAVNGDTFCDQQRPSDDAQTQQQTLAGKFPNRQKFLPHVPKAMRTVIRKALSVDPQERFVSAPEFIQALGRVRPPLDWRTKVTATDEIEWKAERQGQCGLAVSLLHSAGNRWNVETFTDSGNQKRRLKPNELWRAGLTRTEAMNYLKKLVEQLG